MPEQALGFHALHATELPRCAHDFAEEGLLNNSIGLELEQISLGHLVVLGLLLRADNKFFGAESVAERVSGRPRFACGSVGASAF